MRSWRSSNRYLSYLTLKIVAFVTVCSLQNEVVIIVNVMFGVVCFVLMSFLRNKYMIFNHTLTTHFLGHGRELQCSLCCIMECQSSCK